MADAAAEVSEEEDYGDDGFHSAEEDNFDDSVGDLSFTQTSPQPRRTPAQTKPGEGDEKEAGTAPGKDVVTTAGSPLMEPPTSSAEPEPLLRSHSASSPGKYKAKQPAGLTVSTKWGASDSMESNESSLFDEEALMSPPVTTPKNVTFDPGEERAQIESQAPLQAIRDSGPSSAPPASSHRRNPSDWMLDQQHALGPIREMSREVSDMTGPLVGSGSTEMELNHLHGGEADQSHGSTDGSGGGRYRFKQNKNFAHSYHSTTSHSPHSSASSADFEWHTPPNLNSLLTRPDTSPTNDADFSFNLHRTSSGTLSTGPNVFQRSASNMSLPGVVGYYKHAEMLPIDADAITRLEEAMRGADVQESGMLSLDTMQKLLAKSMLVARKTDVKLALEYADTDGSGARINYEKFMSKLSALHGERTDSHNIKFAKKVFGKANNAAMIAAQLKAEAENNDGKLDDAKMREILSDPPFSLSPSVIDSILKNPAYKPTPTTVEVTQFLSTMAPLVDLDIYGPVRHKLVSTYQTLHNAFQAISKDKKFISIADLQTALEQLSTREDHIEGIIRAADVDGNGTISYDEFVAMFKMDLKAVQNRNKTAVIRDKSGAVLLRQSSKGRLAGAPQSARSSTDCGQQQMVKAEFRLVEALETLLETSKFTLLQVFQQLDVDGQLRMHGSVLRRSLEAQGMELTDEEETQLVEVLTEGTIDGCISYQMFASRYRPVLSSSQPTVPEIQEELCVVLKHIHGDRRHQGREVGRLKGSQLQRSLESLRLAIPPHIIGELMDLADPTPDRSGIVTYADFLKLCGGRRGLTYKIKRKSVDTSADKEDSASVASATPSTPKSSARAPSVFGLGNDTLKSKATKLAFSAIS